MSRKSYLILMSLRGSSSALKWSIKHIKLTHSFIGIVSDHQNMIKFTQSTILPCPEAHDGAWWETARAEVGGDDFGESIDLTESMFNRILNEGKPLYITASSEAFKIEC
ncbi:DUF3085 domain-containing protein [Salmonella enterica]|nr:DUF3085 domain-containing protein [Salmonella enterica]